jgi:hypothetical protein
MIDPEHLTVAKGALRLSYHVRRPRFAGKCDAYVRPSLFKHAFVPNAASRRVVDRSVTSTPRHARVGVHIGPCRRIRVHQNTARLGPLSRQQIRAARLAFDHNAKSLLRVVVIEHREKSRGVGVVSPAADEDSHDTTNFFALSI